MATNRSLELIDQRIADEKKRLESRLEALARLREVAVQDPDLLDALLSQHAPVGEPQPQGPGRPRIEAEKKLRGGRVAKANFKVVSDYLMKHGNQPQSIQEISAQTGLKASNVIQIAYRSHQAAFEKVPDGEHKTKVKWKLAPNWRDLAKDEGNAD